MILKPVECFVCGTVVLKVAVQRVLVAHSPEHKIKHQEAPLVGERRKLGQRWFDMEYLNVFGDDIAAVFSTEDIVRAVSSDVKPLFASRRAHSKGGADSAVARHAYFRAGAVILEGLERRPIELGITDYMPGRIDQCNAVAGGCAGCVGERIRVADRLPIECDESGFTGQVVFGLLGDV